MFSDLGPSYCVRKADIESYFIQVRFANKTNVFFFSPITSSRQNRERARAFLDVEAQQEGGDSGSDQQDDSDDQPTAEDCQFIAAADEEDEEEAEVHRRVDAAAMEREAESVMPYFPRAFAVSEERPLQFNFNLFLLDSPTLPRHIEARDSEEPNPPQAVEFTSVAGAIAYCRERLEHGWRNRQPASSQQEPRMPSARLSHPGVDKWELFRSDARRLSKALRSGQPALDENLNEVRLDRWVNVRLIIILSLRSIYHWSSRVSSSGQVITDRRYFSQTFVRCPQQSRFLENTDVAVVSRKSVLLGKAQKS